MACKILLALLLSTKSFAFCGFFVAQAGTNLFNKASKVVMVRDEKRTVLTLSNDFKGDAKDFAMVIPVPEVLEKGQINVASNSLVEHLDKYSAPRLVEYHDEDPCMMRVMEKSMVFSSGANRGMEKKNKDYGVKIEAKYTVGEYDILILSAKESNGLVSWLKDNKYKIPQGAESVVSSYLKQGMKFFVAKVNLKEQAKLGFNFLRPIQVAYSSDKFMLPIRLGMVNAEGDQDLFVFALTRQGRVETINYPTKKLPSGMDIPSFVKDDFASFYKDMFSHQVKKDGMKSVWLEYAWDMNWCDPCAANPLSNSQLRQLGAFWIPKESAISPTGSSNKILNRRVMPAQRDAFITRLHVRYNKTNFPDDLQFQVTSDKKNFQGRYVIRHKWSGNSKCEAAKSYQANLGKVVAKEASNLADLTGWSMSTIEPKLLYKIEKGNHKTGKWWEDLWN